MTPIFWGLAVLAVLIGLLAVPVDIHFQFQGRESWKGSLDLQWMFGLLKVPVPKASAARKAGRRRPKHKAAPGRAAPWRAAKARRVMVLMRRPFLRRTVRLLRDLFNTVQVKALSLRLGLGDPACTGRLWAFLGPGAACLAARTGVPILLEPDFTSPFFTVSGAGKARIIPLRIFLVISGFFLSPSTWNVLKTLAFRRSN